MGENGNDFIYGDDGSDTMYGGSGNDFIAGGTGNDFIHGESGNDDLLGGAGDDTYYHNLTNGGYDVISDLSGVADKLIITGTFGDISLERVGNSLRVYDEVDADDGVLNNLIEINNFFNGSIIGAGAIEYLTVGSSTYYLPDLLGL
ncbi:calcium-binding protein [Niveispirillum fermenti]